MNIIETNNTCCSTSEKAGHEQEIIKLKRRLAELKGDSKPELGEIDEFYTPLRAGQLADRLKGSPDCDGSNTELSGVSRPDECQSSDTGWTLGEAEPGRSPDLQFSNIPDMYENCKSVPRVSHTLNTYENPVNISNEYENSKTETQPKLDTPSVQKPRPSLKHLGRIEDEFMEWAEEMIFQHVHTRPHFRADHNKLMAVVRMLFRTIKSGQSGNLGEREIAENLGCSQRNVGKILRHLCQTAKNPTPSYPMFVMVSERFFRRSNDPGDNRPRRWKLGSEAQVEMDRIFQTIERERSADNSAQSQAPTA